MSTCSTAAAARGRQPADLVASRGLPRQREGRPHRRSQPFTGLRLPLPPSLDAGVEPPRGSSPLTLRVLACQAPRASHVPPPRKAAAHRTATAARRPAVAPLPLTRRRRGWSLPPAKGRSCSPLGAAGTNCASLTKAGFTVGNPTRYAFALRASDTAFASNLSAVIDSWLGTPAAAELFRRDGT